MATQDNADTVEFACIPDQHQLIRRIGKGAFGEVWLARTVLGAYRAVKIVRRSTFDDDRPFNREFEGIKRFEPISREHPGFVNILHVGRTDPVCCFYYVMELADDVVSEQQIRPETYVARTLFGEIKRRGRLPVAECVQIGLGLTSALTCLHGEGLIHRDVKPSNIVYIKGIPQLADPGLVANVRENPSNGGTIGFIPVEGWGTIGADIFALGKVLYQAVTGNPVDQYPSLPSSLVECPDWPQFARLNGIIFKACAGHAQDRYSSADEFHRALAALIAPEAPGAPEVKALTPDIGPEIESIYGAVALTSKYYVVRPTDKEFQKAVTRWESIVLVKGARQVGKTSLLARGLEQARQAGATVALSDLQKLSLQNLESGDSFYLALADLLVDQLELKVKPEAVWNRQSGPNINFNRFLSHEVLEKIPGQLVWGLDEVDRLFTCSFRNDVFGLFRCWHNERALDPTGPWSRLTLAIAYATEAHLFITDMNQSPFNVGTRLDLEDFTLEQEADLNRRYGSPLRDEAQLNRLHELLGGQPYLVRRALNELAVGKVDFETLVAEADRDEGIFRDHLRRMLVMLTKDAGLMEVVRGILQGRPCPDASSFYRLRSAGVLRGESMHDARLRCEIYASYLRRHLR